MDRLVRITTSSKQKKRDDYGRAVARGLRSHGFFQHVPMHMVRGYASLYTLAAEVRRTLRERGLVTAEGEPSAFISEYRQLMLAQAKFLQIMLEVADSARGGSHAAELSEAEADEILAAATSEAVDAGDSQSVTEISSPDTDP
jgi:hypothetical protein